MRALTGVVWGAASLVVNVVLVGCSGDDTVGTQPPGLDAAAPSHDASVPVDASHDATIEASGAEGDASDAAPDAGDFLRGVTAVAGSSTTVAGSTTFCALRSDGSVRCWGSDEFGKSGTGAPVNPYVDPLPVEPTGLSFDTSIVAVGDTFAGAVQQASTLLWGDDSSGELANDAAGPWYTPHVVAGLGGATALGLGGQAGCAVVAGALRCWGSNVLGNVGTGTTAVQTTPIAIGVPAVAVAVADHACALSASGAVTSWGRNDFGQLGRTSALGCGSAATPCDPTPAPSAITSGATAIVTGPTFSCAIVGAEGGPPTVQCWGDNRQGELGGGSADSSPHATPVSVIGLSGTPSGLAAGGSFACALSSAGAVQCWGQNDRGQLGVAPGAQSGSPVTAVTGAVAVAAGAQAACAVLADGTVRCWGANDQGQLGIGSSDGDTHLATPVLAGN